MAIRSEDLIPTRYSLLSRLKNWNDEDSWKDFFDIYWRLIYSFALKSGLTEAEAQDVVQETIISVAKDIQKFNRDRRLGSFKGWLRNVTRWRIADQFRKRMPSEWANHPNEVGDAAILDMASVPEPGGNFETIWDEEWKTNLLDAAMRRVKRYVKEEHYQIFDLNVVKQWPSLKVSRTLGVSLGRVYLAKHRISALIKKEVRALEERWP